jgi:kumamolisin
MYFRQYSLGTPRYSNVLIDGAENELGPDAVEAELDMEVAAAIAPGATQMIYITHNTPVGVIDAYSRMVSDNLARVISSSWGLCEDLAGSATIASLNTILQQAAVQGQAVFAAAGDDGAYGCGDRTLEVDSPADNPYVVGVGGTTLHMAADGSYVGESAWSCSVCTMYGPEGAGGGGGVSAIFPRPAYQTGPGRFYENRTVPDVSADADPTTGYSIYCTVLIANCSYSGWRILGGTSAATPLWAGLATDINQYLAGLGKPGLGSANEVLYRLFNTPQPFPAYHDVTAGNNLFYPAGSGYDAATGIGTPNAWNLARDLARMNP